MAKLSKADANNHNRAMDLVNSDKKLTEDEKEFILNKYNPNATNLTSIAGAFFTPKSIAIEFAHFADPKGVIVDLCAGIGSLSYWILKFDSWSGRTPDGWASAEIEKLYCVEFNPEYATVGKRILPQATWIQGSCLNESIINQLPFADCVISNPPFGSINSNDNINWIKYNSKANFDLNIVSIGTQIANAGCFILPKGKTCYDVDKHEAIETGIHQEFLEKTGFMIQPSSWDLSEFENDWYGAKPKIEFTTFEKA